MPKDWLVSTLPKPRMVVRKDFEEEKRALEVSIAAGANLFDTAAMYSGGASERRLGELTQGMDVLIATKFPGGFSFKAEDLPKELDGSWRGSGATPLICISIIFPPRVCPFQN